MTTTKPALIPIAGRLADETCGVISITTGHACGRPAIAYLVGGCVHEHLSEGYFCTDHLPRGLARGFNCRACWCAPESHPCPVLAHDMTREVISDDL